MFRNQLVGGYCISLTKEMSGLGRDQVDGLAYLFGPPGQYLLGESGLS